MGNKNIVHFVKTLPFFEQMLCWNTAPRGFFHPYLIKHWQKCIFVLWYFRYTLCSFCTTFPGCLFWLLWQIGVNMHAASAWNTSLPQCRDISKKSHTEPEDTLHSSTNSQPWAEPGCNVISWEGYVMFAAHLASSWRLSSRRWVVVSLLPREAMRKCRSLKSNVWSSVWGWVTCSSSL